jgi:formiminoglutamase
LLISVPHAGLRIPDEVSGLCTLSEQQIIEDGDEGAGEIYALQDAVAQFVTTDVARAIVDVNRSEDDRRPDGVVKTHTCWQIPVYRAPLSDGVIERLLSAYYRPYHARLTALAASGVMLGIDCHTMAAYGPPIGPDPGLERPWICISNAYGTCSSRWIELLAQKLERAFEHAVSINTPFRGGHITRTHAVELPWLQLELSRAPYMPNDDKRSCIVAALHAWCDALRR